jgi:6,7-dimethyl-8-ribityllumazine synthase
VGEATLCVLGSCGRPSKRPTVSRQGSPIERPLAPLPGARVAMVVSEFHAELTGAMQRSAAAELSRLGGEVDEALVAWVPGSFELPLVARAFARREDVDAVLCFGLVIKGETTHDHWVAAGAQQGMTQASLETDKPILFGVLTCNTLEQARARALSPAEGGEQDKGRELARGVIATLHALSAARGDAPSTEAS